MSLFQEIYEVLIARTYKDSQKVKLATEAMTKAKEIALIKTFLPSLEKTGGVLPSQFSNLETISLGVEHNNLEIWNRPAKGLFILNFTGISANTRIRFDKIASALYPIRSGYIKTDFEKIYLTNTAQTGKSLQFIVTYTDTAEFLLRDLATNDNLIDIYTRLGVLETYQSAHYLTGVSLQTVDMPTANHEYSQALTDDKGLLRANIRDGGTAYRIAWIAGKVATPTDPYRSMVADSVYEVKAFNMNGKTLYFACGEASKEMEIEIWV